MAMSVVYTTIDRVLVHEDRGGVERQYVGDPLGSLVGELDENQNLTYTAEYWPYGEVRTESGSKQSEWGYVGLLGYLKDLATLLYVRARHYLPHKGRWLTVDPLWPKERGYIYGASCPILVTDPTGRVAIVIVVGVFLILALGVSGHEGCLCANAVPGGIVWGKMLIQIADCGLAELLPVLYQVRFCRNLVAAQDAFGITVGSAIKLDYGTFGRPYWDTLTTAVHEGLHAHCRVYNEEPQHTVLAEWADYLIERCRRCPGEPRLSLSKVCEAIRQGTSPPSYADPCRSVTVGRGYVV